MLFGNQFIHRILESISYEYNDYEKKEFRYSENPNEFISHIISFYIEKNPTFLFSSAYNLSESNTNDYNYFSFYTQTYFDKHDIIETFYAKYYTLFKHELLEHEILNEIISSYLFSNANPLDSNKDSSVLPILDDMQKTHIPLPISSVVSNKNILSL